MRLAAWQWYLLYGTAAILLTMASPDSLAGLAVFPLVALSTAVALWMGSGSHAVSLQQPLRLLALGFLLVSAGDAVFTWFTFRRPAHRAVDLADLFYLVASLVLIAGFLLLLRHLSGGHDVPGLIDTAILAVGLTMIAWVLFFDPNRLDAELAVATRFVLILYPMLDLVLIALAVRFLFAGFFKGPLPWLLFIGSSCMFVSDGLYDLGRIGSTYRAGDFSDTLMLCAYIAFGVAGLHPIKVTPDGTPAADAPLKFNEWRVLALAGSVLVGPALLIFDESRVLDVDEAIVVVASAIVSLLAIARIASMSRELAAGADRFRALVEQTRAVVYVAPADDPKRLTYISPRIQTILGFTPAEIIANPGLLRRPDLRFENNHASGTADAIRNVYHAEIQTATREGAPVWLRDEAELVRDGGNRTPRWQGVLIDDTVRIQAERARRESDALFRSAFKNGAIAMAIVDGDGNWKQVNAAMSALTGYSEQALLNDLRGQDLIVPQDRPVAFAQFRKIATGEEEVSRIELRCLRPDGSEYWVQATFAPVPDGDEEAPNFILQLEDITLRSRAESALREGRAAAEQANLAKSQFLSNMSHELRTPMNAILGYAELMLDPRAEPLTATQTEDIQQIASSASRLLQLINDLLDLSRIEAGRAPLNLEWIDLAEIVQEAVSDVAPQAAAKQLPITVDLSDDLPRIRSEALRIRQIILNLLGNAVKFTAVGEVSIRVRARDSIVEISVQDTGIGIPDSATTSIFDEFQQADPSTTRRYGGSGLGLAIVRNLVRMNGGTVSVASEVGVGSTFTVRLPIDGP